MVREAFPVETANSVPALVEFFLDHNLGKAKSEFLKSECAYHLWRHACSGQSSRKYGLSLLYLRLPLPERTIGNPC